MQKGTLTIFVEYKKPELALEMNREIITTLQESLNEFSLTQAKRYRIFVGDQLVNSRKELLEAGKELANYYQHNRISAVSANLDVDLQLPPVSTATDQGTSREELDSRIQALQKKKEVNKGALQEAKLTDVPQQVYLEYLIQKKAVLATLNDLLSQQYEMAKMDEAREDISFQVIDEARLPKGPFKPKRKKILVLSLVMGLFIGAFIAFFAEYIAKIRESGLVANKSK